MAIDFPVLFQKFPSVKIGVIGDVMLDTYWWGHVDRISPEAPVPVVSLERKEQRIGGAANVALNLVSLGAPVTIFSVTGNDDDGSILKSLLSGYQIQADQLLTSGSRITTNKVRVISRNQQMMRIDGESLHALSAKDEARLISVVKKYIDEEQPAAIILEDYNKGVLTETLIRTVLEYCRQKKVITAVDPKRKHFFSYKGVDIFKPNLKEVREALNLLPEEVDKPKLQVIHRQLKEKLEHEISLITLSEKGIFYQAEHEGEIIGSHFRKITDVSGAGDTVIAVATLIYALTKNPALMAEVANVAGGLVCESVGTVAVDKTQLLEECIQLLSTWK
jgi:D-glycero-beta-D-manno-heptose-7-phosphate kinase